MAQLTHCLLVSSAHNICKQIGPRQNVGPDLVPICLTLKEFVEKDDLVKKNQQTTKEKHEKFPIGEKSN